jgi:peroxiredoxin
VRAVLGVALVAAAIALVVAREPVPPPLQEGVPAPEFRLPRLGDGEVALRELRGKIVLVNFWATWCAPCEQEMPAMQRLHDRLAPRGFELLAISVDTGDAEVEAFRSRLGLGFPILRDPGKEAAEAYQSFRYPESFLVDREGQLVARYIGERDWDAPEYVARVERLLEAPAK